MDESDGDIRSMDLFEKNNEYLGSKVESRDQLFMEEINSIV